MPKSKRNKHIDLTKTKKRGLDWKKRLFEEVRSCVDAYSNVFIFSVNDMRNSKMKNVREQWKHSRFFIGKNKIMAMALGRFAEEEYKPNIHKLGQQIKGQRGLLFSNKSTEEVLRWFRSYSEGDYARSGNIATDTVSLTAGPLPMFPHNLEPYLRQLGLPTSLVKGVIHLVKDHEVCKAGDILTPETAKIVKLLEYEMAEFHITIDCVWSQDGSFMQLSERVESDAKENSRKGKNTLLTAKPTKTLKSLDSEEMEIEFDEEIDSGDSEDDCNVLKEKDVSELQENSEKNITEDNIENSSTMIVNESADVDKDTPSILETDVNETSDINENKSGDVDKDTPSILETDVDETSDINENKSGDVEKDTTTSILESNIDETLGSNESKSADVDDTTSSTMECNVDETSIINENELAPVIENTTQSTRKSRSTKRKSVKAKQRVSLPKTPDANTSQDSPIFRQLRTRSVQFSAKKKK